MPSMSLFLSQLFNGLAMGLLLGTRQQAVREPAGSPGTRPAR